MSCRLSVRLASALILLLVTAGCASTPYTYIPTGLSGKNKEGTRKGKAYYPIPSDAPTGNVRIMSGGLVKLRPDTPGGATVRAVHIRMVLSNQSSATPWVLDPQEQAVSFPNQGGPTHPVLVHTSAPSSPSLSVGQGELQSLDLYFNLPENEQSARDLPEFDFRWTLKIGAREIQESTSFDRVPLPEYDLVPYAYPYYDPYWDDGFGWGWGWGGRGWRDRGWEGRGREGGGRR